MARSLLLPFTILWLLAACADSRPVPSPDRQTHWMRSCDASAECGGLECLCGICTSSCESEAQCAAELEGTRCVGPALAGLADACESSPPAAPRLCLPQCDAHGDGGCNVQPPVVRSRQAIDVLCSDIEADALPPEVSVVASGTLRDFEREGQFLYWLTDDGIHRSGLDGTAAVELVSTAAAQELAVEGGQVVWLENHPDEVRLLTHAGEVSELARHRASLVAGAALALTADSAYWIADRAIRRTSLRDGETISLTDYPDAAPVWPVLQPSAEHLYYLLPYGDDTGVGATIRRIALEQGAEPSAPLARGVLWGMWLDSDYLYLTRSTTPVEQGGIFGLPLGGGERLTLTQAVSDPLTVVTDEAHAYWLDVVPAPTAEGVIAALWRMPKHGGGEPERLLRTDSVNIHLNLTAAPDYVYWLGSCPVFDPTRDYLLRFELER